MSQKGKIRLHGLTDAGLQRSHNEDTIGFDENISLAVLADGMGGHRCGEIASAMTVSTILESVSARYRQLKSGTLDELTGHNIKNMMLHEAITQANRDVYQSAQSNPQYRGMGTTVVAVLFYDDHFTVAHVGDSRLYRLRQGELEQITRDHSYIQELLDCGIYTPEQARNSEHKNLITRAIGIDEKVQIELHEERCEIGDTYLLCSDGVNDMISNDMIRTILLDNDNDMEKSADELIHAANEHGGKDNISALLARIIKPFPAKNTLLSRVSSLLF